jgi:hypothetical protein
VSEVKRFKGHLNELLSSLIQLLWYRNYNPKRMLMLMRLQTSALLTSLWELYGGSASAMVLLYNIVID